MRKMAMDRNGPLVEECPELEEWWDFEENGKNVPEDYTLFSPAKAHFKCPDCKAKFFWRISDAMRLDENGIPTLFNCAYCNDVKVLPGYNSFKARHEDLMAEWDYTKNNDLGYDPDLISDANIRYVSWLCSTCGMKYTDSVKNRIFDKENGIISCPYCSGRKALPGVTSFKALHVMVGDGKNSLYLKK